MGLKEKIIEATNNEKRTHTIGCNVTETMYAVVRQHAESMGMSAKGFAEYAVDKLVKELEAEERSIKKNK